MRLLKQFVAVVAVAFVGGQAVAAVQGNDWLTLVPSVAGLHLCLRFRDPAVDDRAVVARAAARGVRVEPLSQYRLEQPVGPGLVLGYGGIQPDAVPDALARLGQGL